eukprot:4293026-Amphidinium_carterae.1
MIRRERQCKGSGKGWIRDLRPKQPLAMQTLKDLAKGPQNIIKYGIRVGRSTCLYRVQSVRTHVFVAIPITNGMSLSMPLVMLARLRPIVMRLTPLSRCED